MATQAAQQIQITESKKASKILPKFIFIDFKGSTSRGTGCNSEQWLIFYDSRRRFVGRLSELSIFFPISNHHIFSCRRLPLQPPTNKLRSPPLQQQISISHMTIPDIIPESVPSIILNNNRGYELRGENVAEILSMTIDNECDLYGTISISDGLSTQYLFKKSRDESVKTRPGDRLLLTGPDRGPRADDGFEIHVDLKNAAAANDNITDTKLTYSFQFNAPVTGEIIVWDSFSHWPEKWNTVDQTVVKGEFGSLTAKYIVFARAIMAKVEVILLKKGDDDNNDDGANAAAKVYGEITVQTVGNPIDDESVIFKKASDELIDVSLGQAIPLLRSVIPVPKDGYLSVYVDISTSNRKLTRDIRDFYPPQFPGTSQFDLGNLLVKVTWDRT